MLPIESVLKKIVEGEIYSADIGGALQFLASENSIATLYVD